MEWQASHPEPTRDSAVGPLLPWPGSPFRSGGLRYLYLRRVVGTGLGALGLGPSMKLARRVARALWELEGPSRRRAEQNIAAVRRTLGAPAADPTELARACYENIAAFWIETLFARRQLRPANWPRCVRLDPDAELRAFWGGDQPAIFVTGYLGHPGVGAFVLAQLCRPLHVLVDWLPHPLLRVWQADLYRRPNLRLISRHRALRDLPAVLDVGGKVLLIGEPLRAGGKGDPVTFLGRPRRIHQTVRLLAARHRAPVIVFACLRNNDRFDFTLRLAGRIEPAAPDVSQQMMTLLQSLILTHPQQYLWTLPEW